MKNVIIITSVTDPNPYLECGSGSRRAKIDHKKNRKNVKKFHVLKYWMFSFEG
jgi:hypothetical protein